MRRVVDLSVPLEPATQVYPGDPPLRTEVAASIADDGFNLLHLHMGSQTGTHVDAPYHVEPGGTPVDGLDLALLAGPGVLLDVRGCPPRGCIGWDRIAPAAARLVPGVIALLHTGWSAHYGTPSYFDNPYLGTQACERMLELGVRTFLIDAGSIDATPDDRHPGDGYPAHHLIASAGGVIGENLRNLEAVDFDPFVSCLPLRLAGADGAPARAVALDLEP